MRALGCALAAIVLAGQATAQPRYDRKLEEAVMAIVAAKIGDIRGGFAFGAKPEKMYADAGLDSTGIVKTVFAALGGRATHAARA